MKKHVINVLKSTVNLPEEKIENLIEIPPDPKLGDYAFPTFSLAKTYKKNPEQIAQDLAQKIKPTKEIEKIQAIGPYINFLINKNILTKTTLKQIQKQKDKYGSSTIGKKKKIIVEFSSPNIAKAFGIGHLRSTIIGNSISNISSFLGYKVIRINYLGDWGTPFGKIIAGYKKWGSEKELSKHPVKHLHEIYVRSNNEPKFDEIGRVYFKKLESGDKEIKTLWNKFKECSVQDFKKIYSFFNVTFDVYSGESLYNKKINQIINELESKKLLERSDNALIVNLNKYNLGIGLIQKTDGTTLYLTRDIAAARQRHSKYNFTKMFYEVGSEQKLHFKQLFKLLELMGNKWAKDCTHIEHGLYLDKDGKKFATREGKTIFMEEILEKTKELAKKEILKREKIITKQELEKRVLLITRAAIIYGDLRNYRERDTIFDIQSFISFEGNTGPYLLYTYARAKSILRKAKYNPKKQYKIKKISEQEKSLIKQLSIFSDIVQNAYKNLAPNIIANYACQLAQTFNEFYHSEKVIGSENEYFLLAIVSAFSQVLRNTLLLLGIQTLEKM